jgi:UDP-3-O-[3-hydroxymyristoyl] glucosamine N-acyltransferase
MCAIASPNKTWRGFLLALAKLGDDPVNNQFHPEWIDAEVFVAPGAVILGEVHIEAQSSVWYTAVLRGDTDMITIGPRTNVQDGAVLHVDAGMPCTIGSGVTIGHRAVVHGALIEDDVLIGIGAIVLSGARIGRGTVSSRRARWCWACRAAWCAHSPMKKSPPFTPPPNTTSRIARLIARDRLNTHQKKIG